MKKTRLFCLLFSVCALQILAQTPEEKLKALNIELPTVKPPCGEVGQSAFSGG
jgi:hypothetical protein